MSSASSPRWRKRRRPRAAPAAPRGHLALTAPLLFGQRHVAPILRAWLDAHPAMTASALFVDRNVSLLDEGLDLAVRIGQLPNSSLTTRRVGAVRRIVVASPDYRGRPETPDDLAGHRLVCVSSVEQRPVWIFSREGRERSLRLSPILTLNTLEAAIVAAEEGWGITRTFLPGDRRLGGGPPRRDPVGGRGRAPAGPLAARRVTPPPRRSSAASSTSPPPASPPRPTVCWRGSGLKPPR